MTPSDSIEDITAGLIPKRGNEPMVRGDGCWLWDAAGRRFLDMTSAHGIAPLGHVHPALTTAIGRQAEQLIALSSSFYNDRRAGFLTALDKVLPERFEHVFLCNSGAEAIEALLKFAWLKTSRSGVVALKRSFHGRTAGALAVTWNPKFRTPFEPLLRPVEFASPDDLQALDQALDESTGVFLAEVIQGEGGVHPLDGEFLQRAQELCRQRGIVFAIDEIQTGFGRSGPWFAHQSHDLEPDIMALAKGIAGGFPMGAVVSTASIAASLAPGLHGTTFGGSPLACAAGEATIDTLRRGGIVDAVPSRGRRLLESLRQALDGVVAVRDIRGCGLMVGIELRQKAGGVIARLMDDHGLLVLPAGPNVIRLLPALIVTDEQLDEAVAAIAAALKAE